MNTVPNHGGFIEVHSLHHHHHHPHQHQPHCKQQCFVFTDLADIVELPPPELTKIASEKLQNGGVLSAAVSSYTTKDPCGVNSCGGLTVGGGLGGGLGAGGVLSSGGHSSGMDSPIDVHNSKTRCRRLMLVLGLMVLCIAMAGGIPLALQLRQSSLLEARLAFIRRLLTEAPLIQGSWTPSKNMNYTGSMNEMRQKYVGAVLWPIAVPCGAQYLDAVQLALEGIDAAKRITANTPTMHIVESADEMEQTHLQGEVAIIMGIGGGHALGTSLAVLRSLYLLGARFVSITSLECTTPWAASTRLHNYLIASNATSSMNNFGKVCSISYPLISL